LGENVVELNVEVELVKVLLDLCHLQSLLFKDVDGVVFENPEVVAGLSYQGHCILLVDVEHLVHQCVLGYRVH